MSGTSEKPVGFDPVPFFPDFTTQAMPSAIFDAVIGQYGLHLGWMKAHDCPCAWAMGNRGSANPKCRTCFGRGVYWDKPAQPFVGFITYMHTSSAPDEPGTTTDPDFGGEQRSEPTLSIPSTGPNAETMVYRDAGIFDAYVEFDALSRYSTTMIVGDKEHLPYDYGAQIEDVQVYDPVTMQAVWLNPSQYTLNSGDVILNGYPNGTAYVVSYQAVPVFVAYRGAGGEAHIRPFGLGRDTLPRRFRMVTLDLWTRSRFQGDGPNTVETPNPAPTASGNISLLF